MNSPLLAASVLGLLALCPNARAREHTRLVVTRQSSAAECPDEQALRDAVGARLGYEPFALDASSLIVVAFRRDRATLLATVQVQDAAGIVKGERTLSSGHGDCDELASTTALTISILLDPRSANEPPAPPEPGIGHDAQTASAPKAAARAAGPTPAPESPTRAAAGPPKELSSGLSIVPIALGPIQVFSSGGHAFGLRLGTGAQLDLGPRWAFRLPLTVAAATGNAHADYAELDLAPGVLYRFADREEGGFTPYAGAALKLGGFGAGRALLGKPLAAGLGSSDAGLFDEQSYWDGPNFEATLTAGAEISVGGSWQPTRRLSLDFELGVEIVPVAGVLVEVITESAAVRFAL